MSILTQGTQIYALVPPLSGTGPLSVLEVEHVTSFEPGGAPAEQIETPPSTPRNAPTRKACAPLAPPPSA